MNVQVPAIVPTGVDAPERHNAIGTGDLVASAEAIVVIEIVLPGYPHVREIRLLIARVAKAAVIPLRVRVPDVDLGVWNRRPVAARTLRTEDAQVQLHLDAGLRGHVVATPDILAQHADV